MDELLEIMQQQYGALSRAQAVEAGLGPAAIRHRLESGRWEEVAPAVYSTPGHRPSWRRRLWIGHLHAGPGSVVSHESAARLIGFPQVVAGRVTITVPGRRRHPPSGVVWHRLADVEATDITRMEGLPVTTPARTALDLAAVLHIATLRLLVEHGAVERKFRLEDVGAVLSRVRRKGKTGVRKLEQVLDELGPGEGLPRSRLEHLLDQVIARSRLPRPAHEHPLPNERGRTGFVDRCWPEAKLIVEADGRKWHNRFQQARADADRTLEAQALGWQTARLLWEHLSTDSDGTAALLHATYQERRLQIRPTLSS